MKQLNSTIDEQEVSKFASLSQHWWDTEGPLKTLHDINMTRLEFISDISNLDGVRVLDVGCGGGILSEALSKAGAQVTGIDAAYEAIQVAKKHAEEHNLSIDYECNPIEDFKGKPFKVITCMELLEHVPNPHLVLEYCKNLLEPGGFLLLSTINRTTKAYLSAIIAAEYILRLLPRQTHDYEKFIQPSELINMARHLDLNLIKMNGMHYNPLNRRASLTEDVSVNYLLAFQL